MQDAESHMDLTLKENMTRGTGLAAMKDDLNKSYNATEKMQPGNNEQFYDPKD